jgi:hypothetical protein
MSYQREYRQFPKEIAYSKGKRNPGGQKLTEGWLSDLILRPKTDFTSEDGFYVLRRILHPRMDLTSEDGDLLTLMSQDVRFASGHPPKYESAGSQLEYKRADGIVYIPHLLVLCAGHRI